MKKKFAKHWDSLKTSEIMNTNITRAKHYLRIFLLVKKERQCAKVALLNWWVLFKTGNLLYYLK